MKQETIDRIRKFTEDREWEQFHSPGNLAKSIVIEAAEPQSVLQPLKDTDSCPFPFFYFSFSPLIMNGNPH